MVGERLLLLLSGLLTHASSKRTLVNVGDELDVVRNPATLGAAPVARLPMCVVPSLPDTPETELCSLEWEVERELKLVQPVSQAAIWPRVLDSASLLDVEPSKSCVRFDVKGDTFEAVQVDTSKVMPRLDILRLVT
jgi:hypothetical protein